MLRASLFSERVQKFRVSGRKGFLSWAAGPRKILTGALVLWPFRPSRSDSGLGGMSVLDLRISLNAGNYL